MVKIFFFIFIFYCGYFTGMFINLDLFLPVDSKINSILLKTLVLQNTGRSVFLTYYKELAEPSDFILTHKNENANSLSQNTFEINDSVSNLNFYQKNNKWHNLFNSNAYDKFFSIQILYSKNFDLADEVFSDFEDVSSSLVTLSTAVTKKHGIVHYIRIHGFRDRQSAVQFMELNKIKGIVVVDY